MTLTTSSLTKLGRKHGHPKAKANDAATTNPTPSACDIALDGMIVLLARHISREMTSADQPQETKGGSVEQRISKIS